MKFIKQILIGFVVITLTIIGVFFLNTPKENDIDSLIESMTLKEKIGQMIIVEFRNYDEERTDFNKTPILELPKDYGNALANLNLGGIILFQEACSSSSQIVKLIDDAQIARTSKDSLNKIPLLVGIDQEGGYINRLQTGSKLIGNMALAATNNPENAEIAGTIISEELASLGFNFDLAPVVDINSNPDNPVIGVRSFSDNSDKVIEFSKNFIQGLNKNNIISAIKHFPGHGDTSVDSHNGLPTVLKTYEELKEVELKPFKSLIEAGTEVILTAHIQYPNIETETYFSNKLQEEIYLPATLSKTMIKDILRDDLNYDGVIISDSLYMGAISSNFDKDEAAMLAINAGVDILLMPIFIECKEDLLELENYISSIENMVLDNKISEDTINEHVRRILSLKQNHNLLSYSKINVEEKINNAIEIVNSPYHHNQEFELAKQAVTEFKNSDVFPLTLDGNEILTIMYPYYSYLPPVIKGLDLAKENDLLSNNSQIYFYKYDSNSSLKDFEKVLNNTNKLIIISSTYDPLEMDLSSPYYSSKLIFIRNVIDYLNSYNKESIVVSAHLPYDVRYLSKARGIICLYNGEGYFKEPEILNGDSSSITSMITTGIYKIFEGNISGVLPVSIN